MDDRRFNTTALAVFRYQYERNTAYSAYCDRRGASPDRVTHWNDIPPVPAAAFKVARLTVSDAEPDAVFLTSGTTAGAEQRGEHRVPDISIYHASLLPNFRARLLPDDATLPMLSLVPHAGEMPESSLAHMITHVMQRLGGTGSAHFASAERGIDSVALEHALNAHVASGEPVCLLGTSFSYVHWLDDLRARGVSFRLPPGSRLMDTGGYKGRSREVPPAQMLDAYGQLLGIPAHACINEYGMTELCSQMYDAGLTDAAHGRAVHLRIKRPPPWLRVRIVDPVSLQALPTGEHGLVQLFDLANLGSVIAIQTEDIGVHEHGGYRVIGRAPGAVPRGCSIAMDDLQRAVRGRTG
ncbi:MAG TPA: hypothetical protein VF035_02995 [Longimicrobiales bacterium]